MIYLLLLTTFFVFGTQLLINKSNESKLICYISDSSFWKLYNWQFGNASYVQINLLIRKHPILIRRYVSNILHHLNKRGKNQKSVIIYENEITEIYEETFLNFEFKHTYSDVSIEDLFQFDDFDSFVALEKNRRYSGDPEYAYLLTVYDFEDLILLLKTQYRKILPNPRGCYIINFLTSNITNIEIEIKKMFNLLWERYGVFNVNIQFPCTNLYENTFRFDPFVYVNNTWGFVSQFDVDDAIKNPWEFRNNLTDMHGYPLNISMFVRRPTAVSKLPKSITNMIYYKMLKKSGGFGGVDGIVLAYISNYLNFTTLINTPPTDSEYGYKVNNTLVGSLGDVVYHRVAASFNGRFITSYDSDEIEFTIPISNDLLCLLVPKAEKIPQWLKISNCFKPQTWLSIILLYIVISIYWSCANKVVLSTNIYKRRVVDSFFEVLTLFISVPFRQVRFNNQKVFIGICLIFNIIFVGTFQGSLYNSYTKKSYFPDINTLEDLDKTGLYIITSSKSLISAFGSDPKPIMQHLKSKILILKGINTLDKVSQDRDSAAFERKLDGRLRIKTEFTRKSDGFEELHVMNECPWVYYVSYIVPIGSPFLPIFNYLINTFLEAGLISKWNLDTMDAMILENRVHPTEETDTLKPFSLEDMQAAFYLISLGLAFSFIVFIFEIVLHTCRTYKLNI